MEEKQTILPAKAFSEKMPSGLQELYLTDEAGHNEQKLTEQNLKQVLKKIHSRKTFEIYLWWNPNAEGDFFEIEVNKSWIAFQYVIGDGTGDCHFYSSFDPAYLDSDEESETGTIYGSFMPLRYTMHDPALAAKCVEYFARTGKLYPGTAWLLTQWDQ